MILITGGAGFIGSHLARRLIGLGEDVTILDNLSTGNEENLAPIIRHPRLRFIRGDIRNLQTVNNATRNADAVVHLAAITSVPYSLADPIETASVNVAGTVNLLKASIENDVTEFVFASSCAVYGEPARLPTTEGARLKALSPYAASKISAEYYLEAFRKSYGLQTLCFRFFNVYGGRQRSGNYANVIVRFLDRLQGGSLPIIFGDGEQTRDFIHVNDVTEAVVEALDTEHLAPVYNIGTGASVTINKLLEMLLKTLNMSFVRPKYEPAIPGDIRHSNADIGRAVKDIGFSPSMALIDGLRLLVGESLNTRVPFVKIS